MNEVGHDEVQKALVMGHKDNASLRAAQGIHALGHHLEGVYIEARISLIENGEGWLQKQHLEDLVAFLFPAGEAFVDAAL